LHTVSIKGPLGKDYAYSSAGTELVAHALETIYGMPYEVLLTQFVARAAGMHDTRLRLTPRMPAGWRPATTATIPS
jgi:CubicO group peptidase (beta-lactamase class C family)